MIRSSIDALNNILKYWNLWTFIHEWWTYLKPEGLPPKKFGPYDSIWGQPRHCLFISLVWHSSASSSEQDFVSDSIPAVLVEDWLFLSSLIKFISKYLHRYLISNKTKVLSVQLGKTLSFVKLAVVWVWVGWRGEGGTLNCSLLTLKRPTHQILASCYA